MNNVTDITCLTENYRDGMKIYGVSIVYDRPVKADPSLKEAYSVKDRHITGVSVEGNEVILSLDTSDEGATIIFQPNDMPNGQKHLPPENRGGDKKPGPGPDHKPKILAPVPRVVNVAQTADITACDGTVIPADNTMTASTSACEPVVDKFQQFELNGMGYNLYIPENCDPDKVYPLVVFVHDIGVCGEDTKITLMQGLGAVTWATTEWQAKHPCYVLAPQVKPGIGPNNLETIKSIIDYVISAYNIDKKRIYATGQSMGCSTFCEMNVRYPDFFTATLLVAGQDDPEPIAEACSKCKFWILVSNHDERAFPGMNDVVSALEDKGVRFGRYVWDAKLPLSELNRLAAKAREDDVDMRYTVFDGSSVVFEDRKDNPVTNHVCTWGVVYGIDEVKEWLFSNVKD